jgi:hypothetical protein
MQLKLFILPVKNSDAAEAEMNAFLRSHRVLTVKKEFVRSADIPVRIRSRAVADKNVRAPLRGIDDL